jgi:hypothetical protein
MLLLSTDSFASTPCTSRIPPAVREFLVNELPAWKITDIADLIPEDRAIWERVRPSQCPGFARGHFMDSRRNTYAMLLFRRDKARVHQRLVVLESAQPPYKARMLWELAWAESDPPGRLLVISRIGPGSYSDAHRSTSVVTKLDSIGLEAIEAGLTMYYWKDRQFLALEISI